MGNGTAFLDGFLATGNTFKQTHAPQQRLICCDIDEICAWHAVLRDQDRLAVALELRQQFRGLALEGSYEFGTHIVILKYHYGGCK